MKVTYHPPAGDDEKVEAHGHTFVAGKGVEVTAPRAIAKLRGNPHFAIAGEKTYRDEVEAKGEKLEADTGADEDAKDRVRESKRQAKARKE